MTDSKVMRSYWLPKDVVHMIEELKCNTGEGVSIVVERAIREYYHGRKME